MKRGDWWLSLAIRRIEQAISDLKAADDYYTEQIQKLEAIRAELVQRPTCSTCGEEIDVTQAKLSRLRADGALPRCKDCITRELTQLAHAADDPHCTCNDCIEDHRRSLVSDAARAVEEIDPDELERYAAERKVPDGR